MRSRMIRKNLRSHSNEDGMSTSLFVSILILARLGIVDSFFGTDQHVCRENEEGGHGSCVLAGAHVMTFQHFGGDGVAMSSFSPSLLVKKRTHAKKRPINCVLRPFCLSEAAV